jgi:hypothetical protein
MLKISGVLFGGNMCSSKWIISEGWLGLNETEGILFSFGWIARK